MTSRSIRRSRRLAGGLMVLASALLFAGVGALVKVTSAGLPTEVIVFFRNAVAALLFLPWLMTRRGNLTLKTDCLHLHLLRAAAGLGAMYCFFIALKFLRLADAMLLCYTLPIFIPIFEWIWLREPVSRQTKAAVMVGFIGISLVLKPGFGLFQAVILPPEIVDAPRCGSLCFHPSLLPKYRGGNALAWQILLGESEAGVTVFRPDAGVDTGPIVVQKGGVAIEPHHTAASLYFERLYALGVEAMVEAVGLVASGRARYAPQDEARASFDGLVTDEVARLYFAESALELDRWIRGCDPNPGAHARWRGEVVRLYGGRLAAHEESGAAPGTVLAVAKDWSCCSSS